jgi:hypothetical protein
MTGSQVRVLFAAPDSHPKKFDLVQIPSTWGVLLFLLDKNRPEGKAERTTAKFKSLETSFRPDLGARLIAPEILRVLKIVEARGAAANCEAAARETFRLSIQSFAPAMHERRHDQRRAKQARFRKEEMTARGFRSAASSILNEGLWHADAV